MRSLSRVLSALGLFFLLGSLSNSYGATVTGSVKGPDGAPFQGAFVEARNTKTKITVDVLTDRSGRYAVEKLPAGQYELSIRSVGYKSEPRKGLDLTADQNASIDFALQKGVVKWSDLTVYQGIELLPDVKGKAVWVRNCLNCHGFESRMAAVHRDEDGWRDRVSYMRNAMLVYVDDQQASDIVSYLTSVFGQNSALAKSPAELPEYKKLDLHFNDEAMKIVYVEYELPGPARFPMDPNPAPGKDGSVWLPYYSPVNGVAKLDPKDGRVEEFMIPEQAHSARIHSAYPSNDGTVWFTEQGDNRLGHLVPETKEITQYQDLAVPENLRGSSKAPSKHTARVDAQGVVWASGSPLTSFDPKTKKFTEYPEPSYVYSVALDKDRSHIWYDEYIPGGKIYERDTKTGELVGSWAPPTAGLPRRIEVDDNGNVWFCEYQGGKIGRFDPKTKTFKEFQLPLKFSTPYALAIDKDGRIWYSSYLQDVIGNLDPNTGKVTIYPFPHVENTMREFHLDTQGRMWWSSPANNKVGYFYLAGGNERASK